MLQQEVYNRTTRPLSGNNLVRSKLTKGARAYYPNDYFKKVGY